MKTFELFESKVEAKEIIAKAIEQAERKMPDVISWGPGSSEWRDEQDDYNSYEEVLIDQTFYILGGATVIQSLYGREAVLLLYKMIRRRVIALKRQGGE